MGSALGSEAMTRQHVVAIGPVGTLAGSKSRLGAVLDAEEREELALRLATTTIRAVLEAARIDETIVVTPDAPVRDLAASLGARAIRQRAGGLNRGIDTGRDEAVAA